MSLTIVILTKNEALNIVECVENAKQVTDDVLVIDSGSMDDTVQLAKTAGARVVYRAWDDDFAAQRNFAIENSDAEWILYLDADERLNDELVREVKKVFQGGQPARYRFVRRTSAFGKDFRFGVLGPDTVVRLFPRLQGKWKGKVHESVHSDLPIIQLKGYLKHYTYRDFPQYLAKMDMYSTIAAQNYFEQGKKINWIHTALHPVFAFLKSYILQGGFLEGYYGLLLSWNFAKYTRDKYVKLSALWRKSS